MINYTFKTELTKERTIYSDIIFTTGDIKGYRLNFSFLENGTPLNIKNCSLIVKAKRADGIVVTDRGDLKDDYTAYIDIKNSMISKSGEVSFEIALTDDTGMYVTTKEIIASVRQGHGEDFLAPADTTPILSLLLSTANSLAKSVQNASDAVQSAYDAAEYAKSEMEGIETTLENIITKYGLGGDNV
ncbi:MAG: BppU family phage baseplate upper protein [Clostridia bacterium]|nr:BppU family phage baseplate upper protein [Clostridia bacterium]